MLRIDRPGEIFSAVAVGLRRRRWSKASSEGDDLTCSVSASVGADSAVNAVGFGAFVDDFDGAFPFTTRGVGGAGIDVDDAGFFLDRGQNANLLAIAGETPRPTKLMTTTKGRPRVKFLTDDRSSFGPRVDHVPERSDRRRRTRPMQLVATRDLSLGPAHPVRKRRIFRPGRY